MAAATAFIYRQLCTALGIMGLATHSVVASRAWSAAGTSAFTAGPDGSLVPVGFYWHAVRGAVENDVAVRMPSVLRVPAPTVDGALAPIVVPRPMVAHGSSASVLQWVPRLGLLLSARRHPSARALLAATWREWHEALTAAAAATRKEYKALGITPKALATAPPAKRPRDGDGEGDAAGPPIP